ncbi:hypothetical protein BTR23_09980 [Alkalihalophilus pseudofirmus]|nr:hypothetical protein BTR23_09980 [Alkalihalophilus pseudofirmus]
MINETIELYTCLDGDKEKPKEIAFDIVDNLQTLHFTNQLGKFKLNKKRFLEKLSERFYLGKSNMY